MYDVLSIAELFHTERSHVRKLKVLNHFFYRPLQKNDLMPRDLLERLFANLPEVLALHVEYNEMMKGRIKSSGFPIGNITDILTDMVCKIYFIRSSIYIYIYYLPYYNYLILFLILFSLMVRMVID